MDIGRAREIIRILADGADPATGEVLPKESVYNSPEVIRALFTMLEVTAQPMAEDKSTPNRNAGKLWTDIEDDKLRDEFAAKMKIADIVKEHGRTYKAIERRLDHLGLKRKPFWLFRKKDK